MKRKPKIRKYIFLTIACAVLGYALVCTAISLTATIKMGITNQSANNTALGIARLEELENAGTVQYELETGAKLYYFPCENSEHEEFIVVCPGGGYTDCALEEEGYPIAARLNELGYTAFVLEYRTGKNSSYHAPLDDLGGALNYVLVSKDLFDIGNEYALCGFSAGGNLIGLFGSLKFGYSNYNLPKPKLLIMGYPWLTQVENGGANIYQTCFFQILNCRGRTAFLGKNYTQEDKDTMNVTLWIDDNYPDCYIMHGESDTIVPCDTSSGVMVEKLQEKGIPYVYKKCPYLNHGGGLCEGTSADGWLTDALRYL